MFRVIIIAIVLSCSASAQLSGSYYNPKDDQFTLLGLKRAKEIYDSAKSEFERQQQLFEKQLISQKEFERAKSVFTDAEVSYHQAMLAVLFEKQYVSVVAAVKYQGRNGSRRVRLKLANTSGGSAEFKKILNIDNELFESLQPEIINDVYVSLLNDQNAIISQPYEAKIEELRYGKPVTLDFAMLQDLDEVTVNIVYGKGSLRAPKIFLQKDESVNIVALQSEQFSQVVDLGSSANYNMTLELYSGSSNTFKLEVVNLPSQINRYFVDPATDARLSQFKFTESTQTRTASLRVFMPDRPIDGVQIDSSIVFFALVIPYDRLGEITGLEELNWTEEKIKKLKVGYVKLELIPRGIGELIVKAPQLYHKVKADEKVTVPFEIVNDGTKSLNNIEFDIDVPLNWEKSVEPELIKSLGIREEKRATFTFKPPADIAVGKYQIRIKTTSFSEDQLIKAEDKTVTVEVEPEADVMGTIVLIIIILGLVTGIVVFGIKLAKK